MRDIFGQNAGSGQIDPLTGQSRVPQFQPQFQPVNTVGQGISSAVSNLANAFFNNRRRDEQQEQRESAASDLASALAPVNAGVGDVNPAAAQSQVDPRGGLSNADRSVGRPQAQDILDLQGATDQALTAAQGQQQGQQDQLQAALLGNPRLAQAVQTQQTAQQFPELAGVLGQGPSPEVRIISGDDPAGQQIGVPQGRRAQVTLEGGRVTNLDLLEQEQPQVPETREVNRGSQTVTQQFNPQTGRFEDIAEAPRFRPREQDRDVRQVGNQLVDVSDPNNTRVLFQGDGESQGTATNLVLPDGSRGTGRALQDGSLQLLTEQGFQTAPPGTQRVGTQERGAVGDVSAEARASRQADLDAQVPTAVRNLVGVEGPLTRREARERNIAVPDAPTLRRLQQQKSAATGLVRTGRQISSLIQGSPDLISAPGTVFSALNSLRSNLEGFARGAGLEIEASTSVDNFRDTFQEIGVQNNRLRGGLMDAAFLLATSREGGSRLSDGDVRRALETLGASTGDPQAFRATLNDAIRRVDERVQDSVESSTGVRPPSLNSGIQADIFGKPLSELGSDDAQGIASRLESGDISQADLKTLTTEELTRLRDLVQQANP